MRLFEFFEPEPEPEIEEAVIDDPDLDGIITKADASLTDHGGRAIDDFVGGPHDAMKRGQEFGLMWSERLEDAYSDHPSEQGLKIKSQIETGISPIRAALKSKYGKTIKLYRGQDQIRSDAQHRYVLSWTSKKEVAASFVDVTGKNISPITDDEIATLVNQYNTTGKTRYKTVTFVRNEELPEYYDLYDDNTGHLTDGDDIEAHLKWEQELEQEYVDKRNAKLAKIKTADVDIDAIVWITNRFGQSEFIIRNIPGSAWYISHL